LPIEGFGMHGWIADDAVALADGVAEDVHVNDRAGRSP
jgi:hypothetical protein